MDEPAVTKTLYCPKCENMTTHVEVKNDEWFEYAAECIDCGMVWEMMPNWKELGDEDDE
jgi:uncharacterized Zn finger protein